MQVAQVFSEHAGLRHFESMEYVLDKYATMSTKAVRDSVLLVVRKGGRLSSPAKAPRSPADGLKPADPIPTLQDRERPLKRANIARQKANFERFPNSPCKVVHRHEGVTYISALRPPIKGELLTLGEFLDEKVYAPMPIITTLYDEHDLLICYLVTTIGQYYKQDFFKLVQGREDFVGALKVGNQSVAYMSGDYAPAEEVYQDIAKEYRELGA